MNPLESIEYLVRLCESPDSYESMGMSLTAYEDNLKEAVAQIKKLTSSAKDAVAVLNEVAKAERIEWWDDIAGPGYGKDAADELTTALEKFK